MSELYDIMNMSNSEMDKILESFVGKPRKEVEQELAVIRQQIQEVADTIPSKGNQGEQGPQGIAGKDGKQGKDGRDGLQGPRGFDGKDGKDGIEGEKGKDGVSVVNAYLDFDNSLTLELSDGNVIDAGQFNIPETMQNILQSLKQTGANSLISLDDVNVAGATNSQVLTYDAATSTWIPATVSGTGGGGSGTVTSVAMTVPTGLSIAGSPVSTSGTLAVTYSTGYAIPTTANQTNWTTAYGWGNHASAGYLTTISSGMVTTALGFTPEPADSTILKDADIGVTVQAYDVDTAKYDDATANFTGNMQIDGNLTVSGSTVTINATNLAVEDNMIYLNNGSAVANPDLGVVGNYNDGTYRHAGIFRDATDGRWKIFKNYTPEPDASAYIDTAHASFALADFQANTFIGSLTGNADTVTSVTSTQVTNALGFTPYNATNPSGYLTSSAIGSTVQAYDADLTSWAAIAPSTKQDTLVSATNIKTINGSSLLGSGDLVISGGGGGSLTSSQAALATDVQMPTSNTWYDGPSLSLGAGTWLINTHTTLARTATTALTYFNRLTTGTVHYASSSQYQASVANHTVSIGLSAVITLASTTTIKIQSTSNAGATSVLMKAALLANGSGDNATQITAVKIA